MHGDSGILNLYIFVHNVNPWILSYKKSKRAWQGFKYCKIFGLPIFCMYFDSTCAKQKTFQLDTWILGHWGSELKIAKGCTCIKSALDFWGSSFLRQKILWVSMIKGLDSTITSRDEFRARGKSNWIVLTLQSPWFGEHAHEKYRRLPAKESRL